MIKVVGALEMIGGYFHMMHTSLNVDQERREETG